MKLSELLLRGAVALRPGDRVRIRGEKTIMTVVRVMDSTWIAVRGGPYVGHAITVGALERVE